MTVAAVVLAAGRGVRFGGNKIAHDLGGRQVWRWSADVFHAHPRVSRVIVVAGAEAQADVEAAGYTWVMGGEDRTASARAALQNVDEDVVLIHDGARPFLSAELVDRVLDGVLRAGAAAPAISVTDTVRQRGDDGYALLDRSSLVAMQTPQGARRELFERAFALGRSATDDVALLEMTGTRVEIVEGDPANVKITHPGDLGAARARLAPPETRTGFGYDIHRFSDDPSRTLMLGGLAFPGERALDGHSDADVLLHAMTDALLGAAAKGDIGVHFPPSDPRWKGRASLFFLERAVDLIGQDGWRVVNLDATVVAEKPKVMARAEEMRARIAEVCQLHPSQVSIKATTNERMGSLGREEGIAATAIATLSR